MAETEVFNKLLEAVVTNNEQAFTDAVQLGRHYNFSTHTLFLLLKKIEFWCRIKGLVPLLPEEENALVKIQSVFRKWCVRKKLMNKYILLKNLSTTDSVHYASLAYKYYNVLNINHSP